LKVNTDYASPEDIGPLDCYLWCDSVRIQAKAAMELGEHINASFSSRDYVEVTPVGCKHFALMALGSPLLYP
jgi:hypothetical protein